MKEIKGNLITLAQQGEFDIIAHGCNCFCRMRSGIAPQIAKAFPEAEEADNKTVSGDITKLGNYSIGINELGSRGYLYVLNIYSQYEYNASTKPLDYEALTLALRKINHNFIKYTIGLPLIGCGLAGGEWGRVKKIIETELNNIDVTIVHYEEEN